MVSFHLKIVQEGNNILMYFVKITRLEYERMNSEKEIGNVF